MAEVQAQLFSRFGKKIPAGTVLFQEGDKGEEMYHHPVRQDKDQQTYPRRGKDPCHP